MAGRHDWLSWDQYQAAHYGNLEGFTHFIVEDRLNPEISDLLVIWDGVLLCADGIEIFVDKTQDVRRRNGRREVRTRRYSYQAILRTGHGPLRLVRYDDAHEWAGHADGHHRHVMLDDGAERVEHVGEDAWPTLGDVIAEVEEWWRSGRIANLAARQS